MNRRTFLKLASLASLLPFIPNITMQEKPPTEWGDLSSINVKPGEYEIAVLQGPPRSYLFITEGPHTIDIPEGHIIDIRRLS